MKQTDNIKQNSIVQIVVRVSRNLTLFVVLTLVIISTMFFASLCYAEENELAEGIRPFEKVNLSLFSLKTNPVYPIPGETVQVLIGVRISTSVNNLKTQAIHSKINLYEDHKMIDTVDVQLGSENDIEITIPWTPIKPGSYSLTAIVDPENQLFDLEPLDNSFSIEVIVAPKQSRDVNLSIAVVDSKPVERTKNGNFITRLTVKNDGSYASQDILILRSGKQVIASKFLPLISPGSKKQIEFNLSHISIKGRITAEINPRFGTHKKVTINTKTNENDDKECDLYISSLSLNLNQIKNGKKNITVSFRINNRGEKSIRTPFQTTINLLPSGSSNLQKIIQNFEFEVDSISGNDFVAVSHTFYDVPDKFDARVEIDKEHEILERDEANNVLTSRYKNPIPNVGRWVNIGPYRINHRMGAVGRVHQIVIDPDNPAIIYVGAPTDGDGCYGGPGVWMTKDGGKNWSPITDALPSLVIVGLALDPSNSSRLYVVTPDKGIWQCENGGTVSKLLTKQNLNPHGTVDLLIDPRDTKRMYMTSNDGIYRSIDKGKNWSLVLSGGKGVDILLDGGNPKILYATLRNDKNINANAIYKTINRGDKWRKLTGCSTGRLPAVSKPTSIYVTKSKNILYALFADGDEFKIYRADTTVNCKTRDGLSGYVWKKRFLQKKPSSMSCIQADPNDPQHVYGHYVGGDFWRSSDGGKTFKKIRDVHMDHHAFAFDPKNSKIIYTGTDGGIFRSDNYGKQNSWKFIGEGISNVEFYDIANSVSNPKLMIGGTQDNGTVIYEGRSVWGHILGGDGAIVAIDPKDDRILYGMNQFSYSIARSKNKGGRFYCITCGLMKNNCDFTNVYFQVHPTQPAKIFLSCNSLWSSINPGCGICTPKKPGYENCPQAKDGTCYPCPNRSWKGGPPISKWIEEIIPNNGKIVRSAIDPDYNIVYAGSTTGELYAREGISPQIIAFLHPRGVPRITDIEIDPFLKKVIYVSFDCAGEGRIYRLTRSDSITNHPFFSNVTDMTPAGAGLPNGIKVRAVAVDLMNPYTVYAGTTKGVYRGVSSDKGVNWKWDPYKTGMPDAVDISDLEVQELTGVLRASTRGRGVYEVFTDFPVGSFVHAEGRITLLRINLPGTKYGIPPNQLDAEVIIAIDSYPGRVFGLKLRANGYESSARAMFNTLRNAFANNIKIHIEYIKKSVRTGNILRVITAL